MAIRGDWSAYELLEANDLNDTVNDRLSKSQIAAGTQILTADGTAATPAYSFVNDTDTGVYYNAAGTALAFGVGGSKRMQIDKDGLITGSGNSLSSWRVWTPTFRTGWSIGTTGGAFMTAKRWTIGRTVQVHMNFTFGSDASYSASQLYVSGLQTENTKSWFTCSYYDSGSTTYYPGHARIDGGYLYFYTGASPMAIVTSTAPFTWATGDIIQLDGMYQTQADVT